MIDLSILIVSYNTKETTIKCIQKLTQALQQSKHIAVEIIVIDNNSTDGSIEEIKSQKLKVKSHHIQFKIIENEENVGFGRANNEGLAIAEGKYVLFLNSDVFVQDLNFEDILYYMNNNPQVGALTVQITLPNGKRDMASHRGYPTVWRSFTYFFKLEHIFGEIPYLSQLFGGYHLRHLDLNSIHEVEAISGAFFLTRKNITDQTKGFDLRFFMYGEDIDLCYQIIQMGYKIIYYPLFNVLHLKYQSGLKKKGEKTKSKTKEFFYDSMRLFYDKHMAQKNGTLLNHLVYLFIHLKKKL
ncbi:MAG TPA: glycosyltransferase family 2 protein [Patescibacteria group bacterium]|nr:glycosyltransferase family 2 protein [Patescibacteria group bacterium]